MTTIATSNLSKNDVPQGKFNWAIFSKFALTFDPLSEIKDEFDQVQAGATPSYIWTAIALRYFLYSWQRIGNSQGELSADVVDKVQAALSILHAKV